ncbi:MAG: hypothetical protein RBR40_11960 [Tenuifilaceae bacterium]|nr:hypothetical protein [Tenuifilaceae bacterium]
MFPRILVTISAFLLVQMSLAQPMVGYFLSPQSELSKGRAFKFIEETSEIFLKGLTITPTRMEKKFNEFGNITSSVTYNSAGGKTNEIYWEYVGGVNLVRKQTRSFVNHRGWQEEEVFLTWDDRYSIPQKIEVKKNGQVWQSAKFITDSILKFESAEVFNSKGDHIFTERFTYMEASNIIKVMVFKANGAFNGSSTYPINHKESFTFESVKQMLNPNGDVMIETLSHAVSGDQAYYYEYEYDSQGNWIEKNTFQVNLSRGNRVTKKKLENKTTRKITYH